jgi:hypothetical protein
METVRTSETSVYFHEITRRYIPESCCIYSRRLESLISHMFDANRLYRPINCILRTFCYRRSYDPASYYVQTSDRIPAASADFLQSPQTNVRTVTSYLPHPVQFILLFMLMGGTYVSMPLAGLMFIPCVINEYEDPKWNDIDSESRIPRRLSCPSATSPTTNRTCTDSVTNPALRGEKPETNRLSHGTAFLSLPPRTDVSASCDSSHNIFLLSQVDDIQRPTAYGFAIK